MVEPSIFQVIIHLLSCVGYSPLTTIIIGNYDSVNKGSPIAISSLLSSSVYGNFLHMLVFFLKLQTQNYHFVKCILKNLIV